MDLLVALMLCIGLVFVETVEYVHHDPSGQEHLEKDGSHNEQYDHGAVLGSHDLDEEFENMDPAEAQRRLGVMVDKMDSNKDGYVARNELIDWVEKSFQNLDIEEAEDNMKKEDVDEDKLVSWKEYLQHNYNYEPEDVKGFHNDESEEVKNLAQMIEFDKEKFNAADLNKDGSLDLKEYVAFVHPYSHEHMHHLEMRKLMEDYDKNNDGYIDMEEYMGEQGMRDKESEIVDRENFNSYDVDKDGQLDEKEIRDWALPDYEEIAEEEADHLIEESDDNGDRKLTKNEIVSKHKLWVGSSATEYGRSFHDPSEL